MELGGDRRDVITLLATDCRRLLRYSRDGPNSELVEWAETEAARMGVWAAMLGIFAEGDMSVDYRLRKNPDVREMLTELLNALRADLRQLYSMPNTRGHRTSQPPTKRARLNEPRRVVRRGVRRSPSSDEEDTEEVLQARISSDIGRLLRYAAQIRQHSDRSADDRSVSYDPKDLDGNPMILSFSDHVCFMVDHLLPTAEAESLGTPAWLRRRVIDVTKQRWRRLMYGQRRAKARAVDGQRVMALPTRPAIQLQLDSRSVSRQVDDSSSAVALPTKESSGPVSLPSVHAATTLAGSVRLQADRPSAISQAGSSATKITGGRLSFPPTPIVSKGVDVFECSYCWRVKDLKEAENVRRWRTHVMHDLRPYFCFVEHCKTPLTSYPTSAKWIEHLESEHASIAWVCQVCKHESASEIDIVQHTRDLHDPLIEDSAAALIARMSFHRLPLRLDCCPFCRYEPAEAELDQRLASVCEHIGQDHQKGFALMSIPWDFGDDSSVAGGSLSTEHDVNSIATRSSYGSESETTATMPNELASVSVVTLTSDSLRSVMGLTHFNKPPGSLIDDWKKSVMPLDPLVEEHTEIGTFEHADEAITHPGLPPPSPFQSGPSQLTSLPGHSRDSQSLPSVEDERHKCPYCSTDFMRYHDLDRHLSTHAKVKPYVCQTCNARFRRLHDLKKHTKLHTGERPHTCDNCGRRFARSDALARHRKGPAGCAGRRLSSDEDERLSSNKYSIHGVENRFNHDSGKPKVRLSRPTPSFAVIAMAIMFARRWRAKSLPYTPMRHSHAYGKLNVRLSRPTPSFAVIAMAIMFARRWRARSLPYTPMRHSHAYGLSDAHGPEKPYASEKPYACQTCNERFGRLYDLKEHTNKHYGPAKPTFRANSEGTRRRARASLVSGAPASLLPEVQTEESRRLLDATVSQQVREHDEETLGRETPCDCLTCQFRRVHGAPELGKGHRREDLQHELRDHAQAYTDEESPIFRGRRRKELGPSSPPSAMDVPVWYFGEQFRVASPTGWD